MTSMVNGFFGWVVRTLRKSSGLVPGDMQFLGNLWTGACNMTAEQLWESDTLRRRVIEGDDSEESMYEVYEFPGDVFVAIILAGRNRWVCSHEYVAKEKIENYGEPVLDEPWTKS